MESLQYKRNEGPTTKTPSELKPGELAIDLVDGTIYYGKADNTVDRAGGLYQIHHSSSDTIESSGDGRLVPLSFKFKISSQPGNLLEARGGGVGVWNDPPEELSKIFVDASSGDDSNTGGRNNPLKTLVAALTKILESPTQGQYTVFLKAGTTNILNNTFNLENKTIHFAAYGDSKYGDSASGQCSHYFPSSAQDYQRPVIQLMWKELEGTGTAVSHSMLARAIRLEAIDINCTINNTRFPIFPNGTTPFMGNKSVSYIGCIFRRPHPLVYLASSGAIETSWFQIVDYNNTAANPGRYTDGVVTWMNSENGGRQIGACGSLPAYTEIVGNVTSLVKYNTIATGVEWDIPSRTLFGCTVNWNVFV